MKWEAVAWFDGVIDHLKEALGSQSDIAYIKDEVQAGISTLWKISGYGYFITRVEGCDDERELVMVAWQGKDTGPLVLHIIDVCKKMRFKSIRFHSALPEKLVSRFVKKWGFLRAETVYRLEL